MAIRSSGYFNDPAMAQAAGNLASLFAPPSGADAAGWAAANAKNAEASRLAQLFDYAKTAEGFDQAQFDRLGVGSGTYAPNQSYYAVDQGNATARRGQDVTASTSITNNQADNVRALQANSADNQRAVVTSAFGPLSEGQVRPAIPSSIASIYGLPDLPQEAGVPKPMSVDEVRAAGLQRGLGDGSLSDTDLIDSVMGSQTPVQAVGPDGKPVFMNPGAATRTGAEAFVKPTSGSDTVRNYARPDGSGGSARFDDTVQDWLDTSTGERLPQGTRTYTGQLTGDAVGTGFAKTTEAQDKNAYAVTMAEPAVKQILTAFDTGALPSQSDYQVYMAMQSLPNAARPVLVQQISPAGQSFYQNLTTALPYQLMSQSGMAVTEQEYNRKLLELVPVPGEDPSVTTSKRRQFDLYVKAATGLSGPAYDKIHGAVDEPPGGVPAPAPLASAPPVAGQAAPSPAAIEALRGRPDMSAAFDLKFGPGSAARILGGQ